MADSGICSVFPRNAFDLMDGGIFCQELSHLQHQLNIEMVARCITIKGDPAVNGDDQHFRFGKADRKPDGEIGGWWYFEIDGPFKVLIVND